MLPNRVAICAGIGVLGVASIFAFVNQRASAGTSQYGATEPVPAFHSEVPKGPLPATMSPELFDEVLMKNAYAVAARVRRVLYQQPCYCHCDRSQGHGSLLDCFAGKHAAECGTCIKEGFYSYEQTRKGKTAEQIRNGIEKGEWQQVDLSKYQVPVSLK
jgi:Protein of unknown function with PCYCGC motif